MSATPTAPSAEPVRSYAIVSHPRAPEVLLLRVGDGRWCLPFVERPENDQEALADINRALGEILEFPVHVLYPVRGGAAWDEVFVMEIHGSGAAPPATGRWFDCAALHAAELAVPEHHALLERRLAEAASGIVPPRRNPWAQPGWLPEAEDWIEGRLRESGARAAGPAEQIKTWSISCVLRVPTAGGDLVFKAVPPLFGHEPRLTEALSERYPGRVPEVVAIDTDRRWMLMRGFLPESLYRVSDPQPWERALRLLARMQIDFVGRGDLLRSWGCPDRRLATLAGQTAGLLAEIPALQAGAREALSAEEIAALQSLAPDLKALCDTLADYGLPDTLIHGDFHAGNIALTPDTGAPRIYDWTDGALAPPFFDLLTLLPDEGPVAPHRDRLLDAYLQPWAEIEMETLRAAFRAAQALAPLYHLVSYRGILTSVEETARWELAGGIPRLARMLLRDQNAIRSRQF